MIELPTNDPDYTYFTVSVNPAILSGYYKGYADKNDGGSRVLVRDKPFIKNKIMKKISMPESVFEIIAVHLITKGREYQIADKYGTSNYKDFEEFMKNAIKEAYKLAEERK